MKQQERRSGSIAPCFELVNVGKRHRRVFSLRAKTASATSSRGEPISCGLNAIIYSPQGCGLNLRGSVTATTENGKSGQASRCQPAESVRLRYWNQRSGRRQIGDRGLKSDGIEITGSRTAHNEIEMVAGTEV